MRRFLVFVVALAPLLAHAQSGEWGSRGISRRFIVRGNLIFAADGRGVAVYDVAQSSPRRVAVAETQAESLDLAFLSDTELAVATRAGMERHAVTNDGSLTPLATYPDAIASIVASNGRYLAGVTPMGIAVWQSESMSVVARFATTRAASALAWHGDTLLAAVPGIGLHLFDLTGAQEPSIVAENSRDLAMVNNTLYVAAGVDGIAVYDLTDDSAPRLTSRTNAGSMDFARIAVSGSRAFAAELPDHVDVFDLASGTPVLSARVSEPVQVIAAFGTRLFVSGTIFDRFGLPTETGAPLQIFDAADATAPHFLAEFRDLGGPVSGAATDGTLAYVVDPPFFRVIDVSTTTMPREIASLQIDNIGDHVKLSDRRVILYGRSDVQLIDVSNPYAPRLVNVFHALGGPPSTAAFGRNTILEDNPYSGFHVVDFINYPEPTQIGGLKGHYYDLVADGGDVAYLSDGAAVIVVDFTDPQNPQRLSEIAIAPVHGEIVAATEHHPKLLIVQALTGIHVYSLDNPLNPLESSFLPTTLINVIAADPSVAYLATAGSVQAMDLTTLALSTTAMRPVAPIQLGTAGGKVVIADRYSLRVFGPNTPPPPPPPPGPARRHPAGH